MIDLASHVTYVASEIFYATSFHISLCISQGKANTFYCNLSLSIANFSILPYLCSFYYHTEIFTTLFLGLVFDDERRNGRDHLIIGLGDVLLLFLLSGEQRLHGARVPAASPGVLRPRNPQQGGWADALTVVPRRRRPRWLVQGRRARQRKGHVVSTMAPWFWQPFKHSATWNPIHMFLGISFGVESM